MDLRCLNTFIHVAELSSFTRAAERLGYSQPTISFHIKQLEDAVGEKLFERIGHTVTLTAKGQSILEYAMTINRLTEEMLTEGKGCGEPAGLIRIAMADSLCTPVILGRFAEFRRSHPHISLKSTSVGTDEMFRMIDHNETDVLCTLDSHIYSASYVISEEERIEAHFVCSSDYPLPSAEQISITELLGEPFLLTEKGMSYRRMLDEFLAKNSIEIVPSLELGNADVLCKLVCEGEGISLLPDYVTEEAVRAKKMKRLEINDFRPELWKQVIYHRDKWLSPQMKAVLEFLSDNII